MDLAKLFDEARKGNRDAAWQLGDLYREAMHGVKYSPKQAFRWYAESALAGSATGQNNVGAAYEHGLGCQQSYAKAAKWYRLAAEQGLNTAMANLAFLYLNGYGTLADKTEALRFAAEQGLNTAMANLAFLYLNGYGTLADKTEALRWFKRGAAAGCKKSKKIVQTMLGDDAKQQ